MPMSKSSEGWPSDHPLAYVPGALNAVVAEGNFGIKIKEVVSRPGSLPKA